MLVNNSNNKSTNILNLKLIKSHRTQMCIPSRSKYSFLPVCMCPDGVHHYGNHSTAQ